jgi:prophage regulatory protein
MSEPTERVQKIYRADEVEERSGYCRAYIYELIKADKFPKPIKIGARASGWLESDLLAWQQARIAASKAGG